MQFPTRSAIFLSALSILVCAAGCEVVAKGSAAVKPQFKAIAVPLQNIQDAAAVQKVLDQASADGWEYASSVEAVLIFKK
jgi:hypothetical protein